MSRDNLAHSSRLGRVALICSLLIVFHQQQLTQASKNRSNNHDYGDFDGNDNELSNRNGRARGLGCGVGISFLRNQDVNSARIFLGSEAKPGEYPFLVHIIRKIDGLPSCAGVIIDDRHILTIASCVTLGCDPGAGSTNIEAVDIQDLDVSIGDYNISLRDGEEFVDIEWIKWPKSYCNLHGLQDNIAILRTQKRMKFQLEINKRGPVNKICMPRWDTMYADGMVGLIAGWGGFSLNFNLSPILRAAQVKLIGNEECRSVWSEWDDRKLCTSSEGPSPCMNDDGAPWFVGRQPNGHFELVGLVIGHSGACGKEPRMPPIYTRVSKYVDWIRDTIND